jgi:hypothetical protein
MALNIGLDVSNYTTQTVKQYRREQGKLIVRTLMKEIMKPPAETSKIFPYLSSRKYKRKNTG